MLGHRGQAQNGPIVFSDEHETGHIVHVNALHDDDNRVGALIVEAREQRVRKLGSCGALGSERASIGFRGSSMITRSPPRPVNVPIEVASRKPRQSRALSRFRYP